MAEWITLIVGAGDGIVPLPACCHALNAAYSQNGALAFVSDAVSKMLHPLTGPTPQTNKRSISEED